MVWWWWIPPAVVGALGVVVFFAGLRGMFQGKGLSGLLGFLAGGAMVAGAAAVAMAALNVLTYHRLTYERPVATIELHKKANQFFDATLTEPPVVETGQPTSRTYEIHGDEWRIEARVLKWKPWANTLGLNSQYQLDRLSGRYEDTEAELHAERSVYDLKPSPKYSIDLWALARHDKRYAPMVDTLYGGGVFMPMADGAKYEVWITQSGLIARPVNDAARQAQATGWS